MVGVEFMVLLCLLHQPATDKRGPRGSPARSGCHQVDELAGHGLRRSAAWSHFQVEGGERQDGDIGAAVPWRADDRDVDDAIVVAGVVLVADARAAIRVTVPQVLKSLTDRPGHLDGLGLESLSDQVERAIAASQQAAAGVSARSRIAGSG